MKKSHKFIIALTIILVIGVVSILSTSGMISRTTEPQPNNTSSSQIRLTTEELSAMYPGYDEYLKGKNVQNSSNGLRRISFTTEELNEMYPGYSEYLDQAKEKTDDTIHGLGSLIAEVMETCPSNLGYLRAIQVAADIME